MLLKDVCKCRYDMFDTRSEVVVGYRSVDVSDVVDGIMVVNGWWRTISQLIREKVEPFSGIALKFGDSLPQLRKLGMILDGFVGYFASLEMSHKRVVTRQYLTAWSALRCFSRNVHPALAGLV